MSGFGLKPQSAATTVKTNSKSKNKGQKKKSKQRSSSSNSSVSSSSSTKKPKNRKKKKEKKRRRKRSSSSFSYVQTKKRAKEKEKDRKKESRSPPRCPAPKESLHKYPLDYPIEAYQKTLAAILEQVPEAEFDDLPNEHDGWVTAVKSTAGVSLVLLNKALKKNDISQTTITDKGGKVGQLLEHFQ